WCSAPDWTFSTHLGFAPGVEPIVLGDLDRWGAVVGRYQDDAGEPVLGGIEPLWGFSCPLLLPEPSVHAKELARELQELDRWNRLVITGLDAESDLYLETIRAFASLGTVYRAEGIERCVADLSGGIERWSSRRSSRFRQQWRRRQRECEAAGIRVEIVSEAAGLMDRFLAIEATGWKGSEGDGITSPGMAVTYRTMIDRLGERGRLRAAIARRDDHDVGFILGGVRAGIYRGLQLSYSESVADLGVGHFLQAHELQRLASEIHTYDLGMDMDYKRRWTDEIRSTVVVIVHRSP
ncbi:MAG: GNAT family N-acetyltransferase, partial [Acidimicrobiales bacterium]